jgi:hypothetical protein
MAVVILVPLPDKIDLAQPLRNAPIPAIFAADFAHSSGTWTINCLL